MCSVGCECDQCLRCGCISSLHAQSLFTGLQVFIKEFIQLLLLVSVQEVDLAVESQSGIWDELDGMVPEFSFRKFIKVFFREQVMV